MNSSGNQIVVYQPSGVTRIEVRFDGETAWLALPQIAELFSCSTENVRLHLKNIYASGELDKEATSKESLEVRKEGSRNVTRRFVHYNLDAIISVGYRVNSIVGVRFRQWATGVIKERMFAGAALAAQFASIDRRLLSHDKDIAELKDRVDFFVRTREPPLQGVFYDGQLWDACSLAERLVGRAKSSIWLVDSWVGAGTLDILAKKRKGVKVEVITSRRGNRLAASDIAKFNAQYPTLSILESTAFHDRFLAIDDRELYLVGASLKDLGRKCFGFTKMDPAEIARLKARI
ncbi:MAG: virulence RhuM family protein [Kiritimatiellae bacterium]|nr:virulence RhuM family protein [Kiritimatiellia bacterium]MBR4251931.1 virulence RhuM family protein [Kiritimatiellia bacterium]